MVLVVVVFHFSPFDATLNRAFFDASSRHPFKAPPLPDNSVIVLFDDVTLAALKEQGVRWPPPRAVFAAAIAGLKRAGAERVLVDFTFFEDADALEQDAMLAATAAASSGAILGRTPEKGPAFWTDDYTRAHATYFTEPKTGNVLLIVDSDGVARRYVVPGSLAAAAFTRSPADGGGLLRWHGGLEKIRARGVPILAATAFVFEGLNTQARLAEAAPDFSPEGFASALAKEAPLTGSIYDQVRGKIVFLGANASGTFDMKALPVGDIEPGILLHWTAWTNLMAGGFIAELAWPFVFIAALIVGGAVLFAGINRTSLTAPLAAAVSAVVILLAGAWIALSSGWYLPPATPLSAIGLTLLGVVVENLWREQRRKREIQAMFGAYVDPGVVAALVRNPDSIRLGGEKREATVFFSDLAGFTDLSEKLPPEQMVEVVNAYLEETSECLHRHGAYVDKYIGDAVMAVLGAPQALPDHALAGCRAALEARAALDKVNARYATKVGVKLEVRIGLNTGELIVGNLGSSRKKQYTVMGDTVNLASRLEGANKAFGTYILLGEETARRVQGALLTRPLARLRVKGKLQAIEVHTLHGAAIDLAPDEIEFVASYRTGYTAYVERRFAEAVAALSKALALRPDDTSARRLHTESVTFAHTPPPPTWEPVVSLDSK